MPVHIHRFVTFRKGRDETNPPDGYDPYDFYEPEEGDDREREDDELWLPHADFSFAYERNETDEWENDQRNRPYSVAACWEHRDRIVDNAPEVRALMDENEHLRGTLTETLKVMEEAIGLCEAYNKQIHRATIRRWADMLHEAIERTP